MIQVAVTGGSGRLGRRLVRALAAHPEVGRVLAIDVRPWRDPLEAGVEFFRVDVRNPILGKLFRSSGVDVVYHLAAATREGLNVERLHDHNVIGTLNVLRACQEAQVRRLIVASSTFVYGVRPDNPLYMTESTPLRPDPDLPYALDKAEIERVARAFALKNPGTEIVVLRPCLTIGSAIAARITPFFAGRIVPRLLGYDPLVQAISLEDLERAFMAVLQSPARGAYNIAGRGVVPLSTALRLAGIPSVPMPPPLAGVLAAVRWYSRSSDVPPGALRLLRHSSVASGDRARREFGFEPSADVRAVFRKSRQAFRRESDPSVTEDTLVEALRAGGERLELDRIMEIVRRGVRRLDGEGRGQSDRIPEREGR